MSIKSEEAKSKEKIVFWDNYKGLLIILVVFAHFTWEYYNCAGILKIITKTIYLFHMPMFIFVSGYLSKSEKSKSLKSINRLLLYYIIFNFLMMIFLATFLNEEINFIKTYNSYWYLFVLVIMRLTITKISKIKYIIPISIIIALLSGYYSWEMTVISKTMALYPFFLLGYNFNTNKFKDIINKSSFKKIIIGLFYLMIFLLLLYIVLKEIVLTKQVLYFGKYKTDFDLIRRLAMFIISFFGIYTSLYLIPNKKIPFITKCGQNSLYIYVTHRFITLLPGFFLLKANYEHIYLIYFIIFTVIILIVCGSNWFKKIIDNIINYISNIYINNEKLMIKIIIMVFIGFLLIVPLCNLIYYIR